jgi:hypothetical protein
MYGAKLWNVANESKSFVAASLLFGIPFLALVLPGWRAAWPDALLAAGVSGAFLFLLAWPDYPLSLRVPLWLWAGAVAVPYGLAFGWAGLLWPVGLVLAWFFFFTLVVWGTVYYRFLTHEPWRTCRRFYRLVMTNDDSTSGNFFQVIPQMVAPALLWRLVAGRPEWRTPVALGWTLGAFAVAFAATWGLHGLWHRRKGTRDHPPATPLLPGVRARRVVHINIDGCRADRARNPADVPTPCLDRLAQAGFEVVGMRTMYPARTAVGFATMMTGLPPKEHGVTSNFVLHPARGTTLFDRLERAGKRGVIMGIAHLDDIASENWHLHSITSFVRNEEADGIYFAELKRYLEEVEWPDYIVLDTIRVDQTGHMRGSTGEDYRQAIMGTDAAIGELAAWLEPRGFFKDGVLLVTSDHGQGRGIGGHGYWGKGEVEVPFIAYGAKVPKGVKRVEQRSLMDVTPTIAAVLGV